MTQIVLNVEDASLVPSLKQILGAIKGVHIGSMSTDYDEEQSFIEETLTRGFQDVKEGNFAGENLSSLDSLVSELRAEV